MPFVRELMNVEFPSVDVNDSLSELLGVMRKWKRHWAVVLDGKKYVGMVDKKLLRRSRIDVMQMKVRHCMVSVPRLLMNDDLTTMVDKVIDADLKALPVFEKDVLVGVVPVFHLLEFLKPVLKSVRAGEFVPRTLFVLEESSGLSTALSVMERNKIHHVPVVDKRGVLVGMLSLADLLEKLLVFPKSRVHLSGGSSRQKGKSGHGTGEKSGLLSLPVSALMSPECCSCSVDTLLPRVMDMMYEEGHGAVVVTDKKVPVGIVSVKDVLLKGRKLLLK